MATPQASVLLRPSSHYRADIFRAGLVKHGFALRERFDPDPSPGDLLLMWNRRRAYDHIAERYERVGGHVIVAENGYLPRPGADKQFALALDHHNGAGRWFIGDKPRFDIPEEPWRKVGRHVLVLPQRGIGPQGIAMPNQWERNIVRRLKHITDRQIVIRKHPGAAKSDPYTDLRKAHCAVTWASGAGLKAIRAGFPTFYIMPRWIGVPAASLLADDIELCNTPDRSELWKRITWAQWSPDEIESGEALDRLLHAEDRDLFRATKPTVQDCC